jgi:hypothetical protein
VYRGSEKNGQIHRVAKLVKVCIHVVFVQTQLSDRRGNAGHPKTPVANIFLQLAAACASENSSRSRSTLREAR